MSITITFLCIFQWILVQSKHGITYKFLTVHTSFLVIRHSQEQAPTKPRGGGGDVFSGWMGTRGHREDGVERGGEEMLLGGLRDPYNATVASA